MAKALMVLQQKRRPKHNYLTCRDGDCMRTPCIAYKIGYEIGFEEGYAAGAQAGQATSE